MWLDLSPVTPQSKTECSHLRAGCTLAGVPAGVGSTWKLPCKLWRSVCPVGPVSRSILYPFAGPSFVPRSIIIITIPPFLECINYASIQTVPPAIPTWCSYVRINHIAHQEQCVCVEDRLCHTIIYMCSIDILH